MHVCMHVCMYACLYVCMYVCMYVRMYFCTYVYVCMYVCMCACMRDSPIAHLASANQGETPYLCCLTGPPYPFPYNVGSVPPPHLGPSVQGGIVPFSEPAPPSALRQSSQRREVIRTGSCTIGPFPSYSGGDLTPAFHAGDGAHPPTYAIVGPLLRGLTSLGGSQPPSDGSTHHDGVPAPPFPQTGPSFHGVGQTGAVGHPWALQQRLRWPEGLRLPSPRPKRRRH